MSGDRRGRLHQSAMNDPRLTPRERIYLITVISLAAEYVDGKRRHGSKAMGPDGKFSLHLDYIARALGTTEDNAKKIRQSCQRKGHIQAVHDGTFGRPPMWQSMVVRGDEMNRLTFRQIVPPYEAGGPAARGDNTSPLVYRTPGRADHAPEPGGLQREPNGSQPGWTVCRWHGHGVCPDDCANYDRRRIA